MRRTSPALLITGFVVFALLQTAVFVALFHVFVETIHGQAVETAALASNSLGADRIGGPVHSMLNLISVAAVVVAMFVIGFIALIRRRIALAVTSVVLVVGANLSAELLKRELHRPVLGIDPQRAGAGNSFPSGHTAIAASVVVALVLVLPPRVRGIAAVVGALYAALVGVATLSAGWHRPSDAVGAFLIVGIWASLAGILLRVLRRRGDRVVDSESHKRAGLVLVVAALILFILAAIGLRLTDQVVDVDPSALTNQRLAAAYAGAAAGIGATAAFMMALVLLTVHRVVPRRPDAR
jgi:membrane-associated phospholipid phosphatase